MEVDFEKIRNLDGANVLVKPAHPDDPRSVCLRGTVRVHDLPTNQGVFRVEIVLSNPGRGDRKGLSAHEEVIPLSQEDVMRLLACERDDTQTYAFTRTEGGNTVS